MRRYTKNKTVENRYENIQIYKRKKLTAKKCNENIQY